MSFPNCVKVFSAVLVSSSLAGLTIALRSNYARGNPDLALHNYAGSWLTFAQSYGYGTEFNHYGLIRLEQNRDRLIGIMSLFKPFSGILEIIPSVEDGNQLQGNLYILWFTDQAIQVPVKVEMSQNARNLKLVILMNHLDRNSLPQKFIDNFEEELTAENITLLSRRETNHGELLGNEREIQAQRNIGSMIRAQQASFIENKRFILNVEGLSVGIPSETENFSYQINSLGDSGVQIMAIPKENNFNSYTGGVFVLDDEGDPYNLTVAIVCESEQPSTNPPSPPQLIEQTPRCPEGFREVPR